MSRTTPLSTGAKDAGHQLYQALYGLVSEGVELTLAHVQGEIDRLASREVPVDQLIRAAMIEADYRYYEARDDDLVQAAESAVPEPFGRMVANMDVVSLLQDAEGERWEARIAQQEAEAALLDASE